MLEVVRPLGAIGENSRRLPADRRRLSDPGEQGRVRIGHLLLLLLLVMAGYLGIQWVSAEVDRLALADTVRLVVRDIATGPLRVEEGEERILAKARELRLPLSENQVTLVADAERVRARVRWQRRIGLGGYTVPLSFEVEESRSLR
jgi:hypothetical protein